MAGAWLHNCVSLAPEKRARKAQCTCLCYLTWSRDSRTPLLPMVVT
jgi:hypothetical protein